MNAAARQDFGEFLEFARSFSMVSVIDDAAAVAEIRKAHTQFLALLTAVGEFVSGADAVRREVLEAYGESGESYLREVVSDCTEFMLCGLLGLYRSAGGTLRSAIESYLKTFSAHERPSILQRTSVPEVFNDASETVFFSTEIGKHVIADLKSVYASLNAYVHTVSPAHMFGAIAVGSFPRWSQRNERLLELFVRVVRLFLYGMIGSRRDLYDQFDHRNKVITNRAMTRIQRRAAMGVED